MDSLTSSFLMAAGCCSRDPVRSYVSVTRRDNTANLETKQISFRGKIQLGKDNGDVCTPQEPSAAIYTNCIYTLC